MLKRLFTRGPRLPVGGATVRPRGPRDLDRALASLTSPSPDRIAEFVAMADAGVVEELRRLERIEQYFTELMARVSATGSAAGDPLREMDRSLVSEDHGWRSLLAALAQLDSGDDEYKRVAVSRYLQYLGSLKGLLRTISGRRTPGHQPVMAASPAPGVAAEPESRQTLIFDVETEDGAGRGEQNYTRLPKGESVTIHFGPHQALPLMLARHRFTLVSGEPFLLVDDCGEDLRLRTGKNIVGRAPACEAVVDEGYRAISRKHLIVVADAMGSVTLTDLSTHGTFVPSREMEKLLH